MKRYAIATICVGIALFSALRLREPQSPGSLEEGDFNPQRTLNKESANVASGLDDPIRTKSRIRTKHPQPSIEETVNLLRTTIIPVLDLPPDQSLPERIARINELIQKTGVEPYQLRLILRSADPASQWKMMSELRVREVPLAHALKYLCDATKLRYIVRENGIVELTTLPDEEWISNQPEPFEKPAKQPSDETDIFGNDPNAPEETDPFAAPEPTR